MDKHGKDFKVIIVIFLTGAALFLTVKYVELIRQNRSLTVSLKESQGEIAILEEEKDKLEESLKKKKELLERIKQEASGLKGRYLSVKNNLAHAINSLDQANQKINELNSQIAELNASKDKLNQQITLVTGERDNLEAKLSSLDELRKAIREVKLKMRQDRLTQDRQSAPNRGYLMRDGQSTYPGKAKIEVVPLPQEE